jgi:hypothetical protein
MNKTMKQQKEKEKEKQLIYFYKYIKENFKFNLFFNYIFYKCKVM